MRRWPASSVKRVDAWTGAVLWPAAIVFGLASEGAAFGWGDLAQWIPDLAVGLVFVGCGVQVMIRSRGSAVLLASTGFMWFLANLWSDALFVHRGVLVHLLVVYPGWRSRSRLELVIVSIGYIAALFVPIWRSEPVAIVLSGALVLVVWREFVGSVGGRRISQRRALVATVLFSAAITMGVVVRVADGVDTTQAVPLVYQASLCCVALMLTAGLRGPYSASVVDLVVELGETSSGTLRDALADTLGDPTLQIGYWDRRDRYLDAEGRVVEVPGVGAIRSATFVEHESEPFAVLLHDSAILVEPELIEAVTAATQLSTVHVALQNVVRDQLAELSASRRRLVAAADEERRHLEVRLRVGADRHLRAIDEVLSRATDGGAADLVRVGRAKLLLAQTIEDLGGLAAGLHPRELDLGLVSALEALAARSSVPVELAVLGDAVGREARLAVYYVCSEALANTTKHAAATAASIRITVSDERVELEVNDDGTGGADAAGGSGLRGLIDRVESLGGTLQIDSPCAVGTRLLVELPNVHPERESCRP